VAFFSCSKTQTFRSRKRSDIIIPQCHSATTGSRSDDPPLPPLIKGGAESGGIFLEFASFLTLSTMKILELRSPVRLWRRLSLCLRQTLHLLARMGAPLLRHVASWHRGMQLPDCLHSERHPCLYSCLHLHVQINFAFLLFTCNRV
jgi:hypothetical protein